MRKKIALASVLVTLIGAAVPGMATCLRSQALPRKRIPRKSTTAFATIDFRRAAQTRHHVRQPGVFPP